MPKRKLEIISGAKFAISGRPDFGKEAKKIKVNQDKSKGLKEDRRHILHYDEVLKPIIERVIRNLYKEAAGKHEEVYVKVSTALKEKGLQGVPVAKDGDKLMKRLATEINSATDNLVPARADTNKAIEVVRGYTRKCIEALSTEEFGTDCLESNTNRMAAYKAKAKEIFVMDASGSDITAERNRIHGEILGYIEGCTAPAELWTPLHDITYSVTFDFSPNIRRAATEKAINWQNVANREHKQLEPITSAVSEPD